MPVKPTGKKERKRGRAAMEGEGVDLVLSRAVELRLKISNCIHKATVSGVNGDSEEKKEGFEEGRVLEELNPNSLSRDGAARKEAADEEDDDGEDAERLLHIRDALETLEHQLSNLQALQQQQRYEREVALSEIEHSRKMLLDKLKDYKGPDLEVIQEASTFVGETVEHSNDLLLPPYPIRAPPSLVLDNQYLSHHALQKSIRNGEFTPNHYNREKPSDTTRKGIGGFIGTVAKTLITVVGVVSVLSLSGFGPKLGRGRLQLKMVDLFEKPGSEERSIECPQGRVLVWENGEARCVVKERVVIPFSAVGAKPDLDYGCG